MSRGQCLVPCSFGPGKQLFLLQGSLPQALSLPTNSLTILTLRCTCVTSKLLFWNGTQGQGSCLWIILSQKPKHPLVGKTDLTMLNFQTTNKKKISWDYYLPKKVTPPPSVKLHLVPSTNWEEENNLWVDGFYSPAGIYLKAMFCSQKYVTHDYLHMCKLSLIHRGKTVWRFPFSCISEK